MKIRAAAVCVVLMLACRNNCEISSSEKIKIKAGIVRHNRYTDSIFIRDSLRELARFRAANLRVPPDSVRARMDSFAAAWNRPYHIKRDRNLSLKEFLEYCYNHKMDPVSEYKNLY